MLRLRGAKELIPNQMPMNLGTLWAMDSLSTAESSVKEGWSLKGFPFLVPAPSKLPSSSPLLPLVVRSGPHSLPPAYGYLAVSKQGSLYLCRPNFLPGCIPNLCSWRAHVGQCGRR